MRAVVVATACVLYGCGTVGSPIPPEEVGIGPLIERQDKLRAQQGDQQKPPLDSGETEPPQLEAPAQDEVLPPLRPVGGR